MTLLFPEVSYHKRRRQTKSSVGAINNYTLGATNNSM